MSGAPRGLSFDGATRTILGYADEGEWAEVILLVTDDSWCLPVRCPITVAMSSLRWMLPILLC